MAKEMADLPIIDLRAGIGHHLVKQTLRVAHTALSRFGNAQEARGRDRNPLPVNDMLEL